MGGGVFNCPPETWPGWNQGIISSVLLDPDSLFRTPDRFSVADDRPEVRYAEESSAFEFF